MARVGVVQRLRGRGQRGWFEHGEHLLEDPLLEPAAAEALAVPSWPYSCAARAHSVARTVPFRARVGGLHHPAAPPAAHQALQQRGAFPDGAAAVTAWWPPVGPQPILDLLEPFPADEPGMVTGDQHRPLITGQQPGADTSRPVASRRLSVRVRPNTNAPA